MTDQLPGVTAVIPTHDRPEMVTSAVRSVFAQDYAGPIEVLVVFDAAEPFDIPVAATNDRSVRSVQNVRSVGLAGARNTGICQAKFDLIGFLDDDDEWRCDKIRRQVALLAGFPQAPLVGAGMTVITPTGAIDRPIEKPLIRLDDLIEDRIPELNACGILARRSRLTTDLGMVDESLPGSYGEDYDLLIRAARLAPIPVVQDPAVLVSWQGGSFFTARWLMIIEALEYLLAKHPEFATNRKGFARIAGQIAFAHAAAGSGRDAGRWAWRALRKDPAQPRALLALAVSTKVVSHRQIATFLNKRGRGV